MAKKSKVKPAFGKKKKASKGSKSKLFKLKGPDRNPKDYE